VVADGRWRLEFYSGGQNKEMPAEILKAALAEALRQHEIGGLVDVAYRISFAGKGNSGASFGAMQGDLATDRPEPRKAFLAALAAAGVPPDKIDALAETLFGRRHKTSPLSDGDTSLIDAALAAGKPLVDAMDAEIAADVHADLDKVAAAAAAAGRAIEPKALLYIVNWINMTGPPTTLLKWVAGDPVSGVATAGTVIDEAAIQAYLQAQKYYRENPTTWPHMVKSVAKGARLLPA
jgi:hypothetical protein